MTIRLIKLAISIINFVHDHLREGIYKAIGQEIKGRCVILYYHAVTQEQRQKFAKQMDDVVRLVKPVSVEKKAPLGKGIHYAAVTFDDGFTSVLENAIPELAQRNIPATVFVPTGCLGQKPKWIKDSQYHDETVMSEDQLRGLKGDLISIGSHGVTHSDLLTLPEEEAKHEIFKSKSDLEDLLKANIRTLSFPYGQFSRTHVLCAKQAGYERVFSITPTPAFSNQDEYVSGRVDVDPADWRLEFRLKLLGAYRWLPVAFSLKRKIKALLIE